MLLKIFLSYLCNNRLENLWSLLMLLILLLAPCRFIKINYINRLYMLYFYHFLLLWVIFLFFLSSCQIWVPYCCSSNIVSNHMLMVTVTFKMMIIYFLMLLSSVFVIELIYRLYAQKWISSYQVNYFFIYSFKFYHLLFKSRIFGFETLTYFKEIL